MPATKDHVLAIARSQLGYRESGQNKQKYGAWYGFNGQAWCAIFVSWVADRAQAEDIIPRHAYTPAGAAWFVKHGRWSQKAHRGDIVYYEFPGMNRISHVGFVEAVHRDGSITAIEGNTDVFGGRTGGKVMRKRRSRSLIAGFGHPDYSTPAQMARLRREAEAAAKRSRLAKARAAAAAKAKAARERAAKALADKKARARAAAAAAALVVAAGGGAAVGGAGSEVPQPTATPTATSSATPTPSATGTPSLTPTPTPTITAAPKPTATPTRKPTVKPAPVLTRTLRYTEGRPYMHGADVRRVQALVGAKVDDDLGPATAARIRVWQRAHHLRATGLFGRAEALAAGWAWKPNR